MCSQLWAPTVALEVQDTLPTATLVLSPISNTAILNLAQSDAQGLSLAEALAQWPGMQLSTYGGWGNSQTLNYRGVGSKRLHVLLDGFELNDAQGGGVDFSALPISLIATAELNPSHSIAPGGTISLTRSKNQKPSGRFILGSAGLFGAQAWLSGSQGSLAVLHNQARNDFEFTDHDLAPYAPELTQDKRLENAQVQDDHIQGLWDFGWGQNRLRVLSHLLNKTQGIPGQEGYWNPTAHWEQFKSQSQISLVNESREIQWEAGLAGSWQRDQTFWTAHDPSFVGNATTGGRYRQAQNKATGFLRLCKEWAHWKQQISANFAHFQIEPWDFPPHWPALNASRKQGQILSLSTLYATHWSVETQIGWSTWSDTAHQLQGAKSWDMPMNTYAQYHFNHGKLFGRWQKSTEAPALGDLYGAGAGNLGNPDLKPEQLHATELGFQLHWKTFQWETRAYSVYLDQAHTRFYATGQSKALNLGGATFKGIENQVIWSPGHWQHTIQWIGQITRIQSKRAYENNKLVPEQSPAHGLIRTQYSGRSFGAGTSLNWTTSAYRNANNSLKIPAGTQTALWTEWNVFQDLKLRASIHNLENSYRESPWDPSPQQGRRWQCALIYTPTPIKETP